MRGNSHSPSSKSPKPFSASGDQEMGRGQWRIKYGSRSHQNARTRVRNDTKALEQQVDQSRSMVMEQQVELDRLRKIAYELYKESRRVNRGTRSPGSGKSSCDWTRQNRGGAMAAAIEVDEESSQVSGLSGSTLCYPQFALSVDVGPFNGRPASGGLSGRDSVGTMVGTKGTPVPLHKGSEKAAT